MKKGTQTIPHGNKSFFDHLNNTYKILKYLKQEEDVCLAGLLHSIYGNEIFHINLGIDREEIKVLVGIKVEKIVYLFNIIPRNKITTLNIKSINMIVLANQLEQDPNYKEVLNV
jgi:hypothetical protein